MGKVGRDPGKNFLLQTDMEGEGFNILNVNAVGNVQSATLYVDPAMTEEIGERATGLPFMTLAAAVAVAEPGDTIVLRPGIHAFDGSVDLFHLPGLFIVGYGAIIKSFSEENESSKIIVRSGAVTIIGMEFDGDVTGTPEATTAGCIDVQAPGCTIRDCYIHNQNGYGIHLSATFDEARITDCWIEACLGGISGELLDDTVTSIEGVWVKRCTITRNRTYGVVLSGPGPENGEFITGIQITDNKFVANDTDNTNIGAVAITAACRGVQVDDNHFEVESNGVVLARVKNASVSGNHLKAIATNGIQLTGCIGVKVNDNYIDGRNSAGSAATDTPIFISNSYLVDNDAAQFVITGNELVFLKVNSTAIDISNATGIIINSNRIEGPLLLTALVSVVVNGNSFSIPQTTQAIIINAGDRGSSKLSIVGNRFNFSGASVNRCITTVDAAATGVDDVLIEGNATPGTQFYNIASYGHSGANTATRVVQIGNVPESATATFGWANVGVPVNQLLVSQSKGVDATAQRQTRTTKYKTINAAIVGASAGDTIVVEDGVFNERIDAKTGVTVRFLPQATLICSTAGGCIRSTATNQIFTVYHEHATIQNSQTNTPTVSWTHTGGVLTIHGPLYNSGTGSSARAINCTDGIIELFGTAVSSAGIGIFLDSGGTAPVVHVHGGLNSNPADILGNGTGVGVSVQAGEFIATNCRIYGVGSAAATLNCTDASIIRFRQCTLVSQLTTAPAISIPNQGSCIPILRDCVLVAGATSTQSINATGAQTIKLYGQTVANKGADPPTNVTFSGGGTYDVNANVTAD